MQVKTTTISARVPLELKEKFKNLTKVSDVTQTEMMERMINREIEGKFSPVLKEDATIPENLRVGLVGLGALGLGVASYKGLTKALDNGTRTEEQIKYLAVAGAMAVATMSALLLNKVLSK